MTSPERSEPDGTRGRPDVSVAELQSVARRRFRAGTEVPEVFFEANADRLARACRDLARAFHRGHRLLVFGRGAQRSDALHVSVEFVHPVIVGKRALPAIALPEAGPRAVRAIGEPGDTALALHAAGDPAPVREALGTARAMGMTTLAMLGPASGDWRADHVFSVPSDDPYVVQEVHETAYHVLWELVHVFLEHLERSHE